MSIIELQVPFFLVQTINLCKLKNISSICFLLLNYVKLSVNLNVYNVHTISCDFDLWLRKKLPKQYYLFHSII